MSPHEISMYFQASEAYKASRILTDMTSGNQTDPSFTMSELFMECEEEELEPWQKAKAIPEINLVDDDDDDDDEPIFVGEIQSSKPVNSRPSKSLCLSIVENIRVWNATLKSMCVLQIADFACLDLANVFFLHYLTAKC